MKRKIASFLTAVALSLSAGLINVHAEDPEPAPTPVVTNIVTDAVINPTGDTFTFTVEIQGTDLTNQVAVFLKRNGDPEPTDSANSLNLSNINAEKTSGSVEGTGVTPDSPLTLIVYTSVDNAQTWVASSTQVTVNPLTSAVSSVSIDNGEMVHSGATLTAQVQGNHLNSSIQFRGSWDGSDVVSLSNINPDETTGVLSLQLPENSTDKAIVYTVQFKIGTENWTDAKKILLMTTDFSLGFRMDTMSFPNSGGTADVHVKIKGMGKMEAIRFSLVDRNGNIIGNPAEADFQASADEIYTISAALAVPANADSGMKNYFVAIERKQNWWNGEAEWSGRSNQVMIAVAGKPSDNNGGSSGNDSPSTPTTPVKEEPAYTADVISKASPNAVAVDVQNILAFGNDTKKSEPIALAELKADDKKVQVNVIPKNLPSNISSNQIQTVLNAVSSVNFSKTPAEAKQAIDKVTKEAGAGTMYVNFAVTQHVEFGFPVQVTVPTSFAKGTACFLYYWNDSKKTYEQVDDFTIDPNGNATFSIRHCSDYFIADKQLAGGLSAGESSSDSAADVTTTLVSVETALTTAVTETAANPKTGNAASVALVVVALAAGGVLFRKVRK